MRRAAVDEVWINDVVSIEVIDGEVRVVLACTRDGEQVPRVVLVGPTVRAPEITAKILTAIGNACMGRPN